MKKLSGFQFVAGFVLGAAMFGGAAAYAAGVIANPTTSRVFVNGQEIRAEAYNIQGSNYFKLRDIAAAVDFSVEWDGAIDRILIDTNRGYDQNVQQSPQSPAASTTGGYGTVYNPLRAGDVVKTPSGDYTIMQGAEDMPWRTSDGTTWPNVPLPAWQPHWDSYPRVALPDPPAVRHTGTRTGTAYDTLYVFNGYEVERMIRTIYRYAINNPSLWQDRNPGGNIPNFTIAVEFTDDMVYNTFYPWRDMEVEKLVNSTFGGKEFRIYAVDNYNNGRFVDTEYFIK